MTPERRLRDDLDEALARIHFLERAMGTEWEPPACFNLTGCEAEIFGVLMKNAVASYQKFDALEISSGNGCIKAHIYSIRRKVAPHGIEIHNKFGVGYFMTDQDKAKVNEMDGGS